MTDEPEIAVGLFPGQGAYSPTAVQAVLADPTAAAVLAAVDEVAVPMLGRGLRDTVLTGRPPSAEELLTEAPDVLQLAVFGLSVAAATTLSAHGVRLSTMLGHSLGEIAALVAGGALSVVDGTEIVCHRITVLREHDTSGGGMLALTCDRDRTERILDLLPSAGAVLAVDNGAGQTAVSGPADALNRIAIIAGAVGVPAIPLRAPHPFHNATLAPARIALGRRIGGYRSHGLHTPVFSPILGRYYRDEDDLGELLALHLVTPVDFGPAVTRLYRGGARVWVEIGPGRTLTSLVRNGHPTVTVLAPLSGHGPGLDDSITFLNGPTRTPVTPSVVAAAAPVSTPQPAVEPVRVSAPAPVPASVTVATPVVAQAPEPVAGINRTDIADRVRSLYAAALEYPEDVFEDHAELEGDLGIDSVKQTELMGQVGQLFELGPRPQSIRLADYRTFGRVVDFVEDALAGGGRR